MSLVTLGRVIFGSQSNDCLGISASTPFGRQQIISYIERAIELAAAEANWLIEIGTLDMCCDALGVVTLPYFVGTVLAINVNGLPTYYRNSWYEFHINGLGDRRRNQGQGGGCGQGCGWYSDDLLWTPTIRDLTEYSMVVAVCEDPVDGNSGLNLIVQGETMDKYGNQKEALTIPATGPSQPGVIIPLINNYASTDQAFTMFKKITQVTKPVTRGYVKLLGINPATNQPGVVLGYYAPNECNPRYRRIRVQNKCANVRVRYRRAEVPYQWDYEILPIASYQAILDMLRVVRYREVNRGDDADKMMARVVDLLTKIEAIEQGPAVAPLQVDPSFGVGTIDPR